TAWRQRRRRRIKEILQRMTRNTGHNTGLASGGLTFTAEISCRNSRPNAKPLPVERHSAKARNGVQQGMTTLFKELAELV
ncbi:MAG: hypothetical protein WBG34_12925, partial [Flavobacteriales bacterium]